MISEKPVILAVDSDTATLDSITSLLKNDFNVNTAVSGKEAMRFLLSKKADLILLEINIEDISGIGIFDLIKASPENSSATVIFLTTADRERDQIEALEKGAADYVIKPIKPQILLHRIKMQMELRTYRDSLEKKARKQNSELREAYNNLRKLENVAIDLLSRIIKFRDKQSVTKLTAITEYTKVFVGEILKNPVENYSVTAQQAEDIIRSCKFYDIGMIAISDDILLKGGKLTEYEYDIVRKHTLIGGSMLKEAIYDLGEASFLDVAYDMAMYHHEKWDGSGYPQNLGGLDIPLPARILAITDVYDALISSRPYRKALSHEQAMKLILEGEGKNFDPFLLKILLKIQDKFEDINVKLNL